MLRDALDYPRRGDDAVTTVLIGGLLTLFSVLLLPLVPILGYAIRVFRDSAAEEDVPPVFDDWGELFTDGLQGLAVTLAYFAVPLVTSLLAVLAVAVFLPVAVVGAGSGPDPAAVSAVGGLTLLVFGVLGLVSLVWSLAAGFLLPAALARLAATDEIGSAFALRSVWRTAATSGYVTAWLLALVVGVATSVVSGLLGFLPVVGAVAAAFVAWYATVVSVRLYAAGVEAATPTPPSGEEPTTEQAI